MDCQRDADEPEEEDAGGHGGAEVEMEVEDLGEVSGEGEEREGD